MKKILRRMGAAIMAVTMVLSMTGCKGSEGGSNKKKEEKTDTKNMVYEGTDLVFEGIEGEMGSFYVSGDKIYFNTYEWFEKGKEGDSKEDTEATTDDDTQTDDVTTEETTEENTSEETSTQEVTTEEVTTEEETTEGDTTTEDTSEEDTTQEDGESDEEEMEYTTIQRMYVANIDGTNVKEIPLQLDSESEYINNIMVDSAGALVIVMSSYDMKTEKQSYFVIKMDESGNETERTDITKNLNLSNDTYISKILMDSKNRMIVACDQSILILDENYKSLGEIKSDEWISGAAVTKDGKVVCGFSPEKGAVVKVLDVDNKKWGEEYEVGIRYFNSSDSLMSGSDYDFYYCDDSGVYGYSMADKKNEKLLDYMASSVDTMYSNGMVPIDKDNMLCMSYGEEGSILVKYTKVDPSTIEEKEVITVGAVWVDEAVKRAAIKFNKENKKYKIEIKDYSNEEDGETKMNADIVAGNVPDIIVFGSLPVEQYAAKGLLEDLEPYFEKDEEVKTSDILEPVLNAMKSDGKLYYVTPAFGISTLIGSAKDVGKENGWTFDDFKKVLESKGSGTRPFYSENKSEILYSLLGNGINDFIDWGTGECRFDSQDFKDILEICNTGKDGEPEYDEDSPSMPSLLKEDKVLLMEGWVSLEEIQTYRAMFNEDITFIGYPSESKEGSYFTFNTKMGIYSKSKVKDGAWEFLRIFMTKQYQGKDGDLYEAPVRKDCFDLMIKARTTKTAYTDEFGTEITPIDYTSGWDDMEIKMKPCTEEDVQMYKDLINNTTKVGGYNNAIMEIISEEAKTYFAGEKSLDEVAGIIQNRIKTYVNENR